MARHQIWFASDHHFNHTNIWKTFKLADGSPARRFGSTEEMNETMVERHNQVVRPQDHVYFLGDVTMWRQDTGGWMARFMSRLNGHKRIVLGNHDALPTGWYYQHFEKVFASRVLDNMLFTHIPVHVQSLGRFTLNAHGHTHCNHIMLGSAESHTKDPRYVNCCVEQTGYRPLSLEEVKERGPH